MMPRFVLCSVASLREQELRASARSLEGQRLARGDQRQRASRDDERAQRVGGAIGDTAAESMGLGHRRIVRCNP